jgi:pimeloyl-ACP methyl ester carboxylesterase
MECKVRDVSIYYEIHGSGTPILMIHGWTPDHHLMKGCMEPIFQSLNTPWQRIYFDLPGMGKTKGQPWINGSDQMLELIIEFIDKLIPDQNFVLAGESYGGYLARGIIKQRTSQVNGLLLICPNFKPGYSKANVPALQVFEKDEALLNSVSEEDRQYFEGINVLQTKQVWEKFERDILSGLKIADYSYMKNRYIPCSNDVDLIEKPYQQPALIILGRHDSSVGYRDQWQFIENFPRASFVILDKAGHNLQIEQEVLFNELVKEWLNRVFEAAR